MAISVSRNLARGIAAAAGLLAALATPAYADAIDGEWCRDNRNFTINGPNIITYAGTNMTGDYDRHGFRYVAPPGEPEAGTEIEMQLRSDDLLDLYRKAPGAAAPGEAESWRRCKVTS